MNRFKYTYLTNTVDQTYFKYWFFKKLTEEDLPSEPAEGEGTNFKLKVDSKRDLVEVDSKGDAEQTGTPSPDTPASINVVTGDQTLTITHGSDEQSYSITLGDVELCKIGDYQDYIYKDGDDWYIHKDIGKYTFDGTENWSLSGSNLMVLGRTTIGAKGATSDLLSDIATANYNYGTNNNECYIGNSNIIFSKMNYDGSAITSADDWKTYLSENNSVFYFPLASATNTKITDETLIGELEDILTNGYLSKGSNTIVTSATSPDLPNIIYIKSN